MDNTPQELVQVRLVSGSNVPAPALILVLVPTGRNRHHACVRTATSHEHRYDNCQKLAQADVTCLAMMYSKKNTSFQTIFLSGCRYINFAPLQN